MGSENSLEPSFKSIKLSLTTGNFQPPCCVNINDEEVSSPFWTISLVSGQNLYGKEDVADIGYDPHSIVLTESEGTTIPLLSGASVVAQ